MLPVKTHIATHQLVWIITDCFGEEEIITMADQCGILHDSQRRTKVPQDWIVHDLAACFFNGALTENIVSQCLAKKTEQAARRVQFMNVQEIQVFLRSVEQLRAEGEFGEILWALLVDSREDVQKHGHRLLADHEQSLPPSTPPPEDRNYTSLVDTAQEGERLESDTADLNIPPHRSHDEKPVPESMEPPPTLPVNDTEYLQITPVPETDSDPGQASGLSDELKQNQQQINKLYSALSELKNGYTILQNENDKLKEKIAAFVEENQISQDREALYRENELRIDQLNRENKSLKQDVEKFSNQLCEFHELQVQKEKITVELKSVEEMAYHSQQALEQIQSNFYSQFSYLQGVNEEYKTVITRARQKITSLTGSTAGTNRMLAGQPRVGVFVDVQNMFYAAKDRYARRLDYIKLLDLIVGPRNLVAAYAYVVQIPEINQAGFLSLLEHNGYTIKSKDLRMRGDGSAKGDWDVGIAIDIVSMLDALDIVVLASGDGDFCALAELIKQHGKRIEVAAFEHNTSMDLQRIADQFFPIGDEMLI